MKEYNQDNRYWFNMFNNMSVEKVESMTNNTTIEVILKGGNCYISARKVGEYEKIL